MGDIEKLNCLFFDGFPTRSLLYLVVNLTIINLLVLHWLKGLY